MRLEFIAEMNIRNIMRIITCISWIWYL